MKPNSRAARDLERARRAGAALRAQRRPAMEAALAQIGAAFDEAACLNAFKLKVERMLRFGPSHPAVRARYGSRAALLSGRDLDAAIAHVERWWRDERRAFQIASALGRGSRMSVETVRELRLILRLMRAKGMQAEFCSLIAAVCGEATLLAAE
jgi:hypothetical protein